MTITFWSPTDEKEAEKKLYYVLAYPSKEEAGLVSVVRLIVNHAAHEQCLAPPW